MGRPSSQPRGGRCGAPRPFPGGRRPRRPAVTATSSPLFTSVFSSLITRFIAFARGKPGDGGAGEDPPRKPPLPAAPPGGGGGELAAQPGLPPHRPAFSRVSGGAERVSGGGRDPRPRRVGGSPGGGRRGAPRPPAPRAGSSALHQRDLRQRRGQKPAAEQTDSQISGEVIYWPLCSSDGAAERPCPPVAGRVCSASASRGFPPGPPLPGEPPRPGPSGEASPGPPLARARRRGEGPPPQGAAPPAPGGAPASPRSSGLSAARSLFQTHLNYINNRAHSLMSSQL